jgi:signal transduction histidine kinase
LKIELEKTKKLDRQKSEFLAIAAHQLRTPMAGIKWVVSMAVEGDLGKMPEEAGVQLGKSLENIDRMIALINSLLDVTQIETKGIELKPEGADPVALLRDVASNLEHAAQEAKLTLAIAEPKRPVPKIKVDVEKIGMVFRNLLDNAIKYTPKGGTVTVGFAQRGDQVEISVSDTGYGIPKAEQDRIFTKFYRGSNIQTVVADGSGLGLYVVSQIVKLHDGSVAFESEEGKGTTFTISLPVYVEPAAAPAAAPVAAVPAPAPTPPAKKSKRR